MSKARLAVDIGGTFTDVALETDKGRVTTKTLTTPRAPEEGVMTGVTEALAKAALHPSDISVIIHGTTLATNALIERRGAVTALLTTEGHRDALEMAQENRFEQYDINIDRPEPLVPRWLRLPIRERMNVRGEPLIPLDEASARAVLPVLEKERVESVAIGFLHAYVNKEHEWRAAEIIAEARPDLSITLASEAAPEIREYERLSTAVANAYVRPLMERYLKRLEKNLSEQGFDCPFLLITSGGGLTSLETAARFPIRLVESGPAGGAVLAAAIAKQIGASSMLSFDMGGTTAKLCLIDEYTPATARTFEVDRSYRFKRGSGLPVRIPVIEMVEIGAGGGSIASVDALNRIQVGPESTGSEPGPACYGRGGVKPAVTDADAASGKIAPDKFAGGAFTLDLDAAKQAIAKAIGAPLNLEDDKAGFALSEVVDENMAAAARAHAVEQGKDIAARTMIAFGGAAPLHAARLGEKLGVEKIIVPADAGVGSAVGFLLAPVAYEVVRSRPMHLDQLDENVISALYGEMHEEAVQVVRAAAGEAPLREVRTVYMRYAGQGYEIPIDIIDGPKPLRQRLQLSFEKAYEALYGRTIPSMPVEALTWSLSLSGPAPQSETIQGSKETRRVTAKKERSVFDPTCEERLPYGVLGRADLKPGDMFAGPALIVESQTTTVVTSTYDGEIDAYSNIVLNRKAQS